MSTPELFWAQADSISCIKLPPVEKLSTGGVSLSGHRFWLLVLAGAAAGTINGLFGAGGGMVLVPILGESFLELVSGEFGASSVGVLPMLLGFVSAFVSGLLACRLMMALVKKARLRWFALYCLLVAVCIFVFA